MKRFCARRLVVTLIACFALIISSPGLATRSSSNIDAHSLLGFATGFVVIGVTVGGAIALLTSKNKNSPATTSGGGAPLEIVYKDSTPAVYAFPDGPFPGDASTDGVITIRNNTAQPAQLSASIIPDPDGKANIQLLPSSTCNSPVAAGGTCSYNFSYSSGTGTSTKDGTSPSITAASTIVKIQSGNNELSFTIQSFFPSYNYFLTLPHNTTTFNYLPSNNINSVFRQGDTVYIGTDRGLGISHDNGVSWTTYTPSNGLINNYIYDVYVLDGTIYAATDGGLSISSDNGLSWRNYKWWDPSDTSYIFSVYGVYVVGSTIYAATEGGLAVGTDDGSGGTSWQRYTTDNGLQSNYVYGVYVSNGKIYAATYGGGLSVGTDDGSGNITWVTYTKNEGLASDTVNGVYVVGNTIYAATDSGLSAGRYDGNGNITWTTYTTPSLGDNYVYRVYVLGNTVYASTYGGLSVGTDNGSNITWMATYAAPPLTSNYVYDAYVSNNTIYAATSGGLSVSADNGNSWTNYTPPVLLDPYMNGLYVLNGAIYAATYSGLAISRDKGFSWKNYTDADGLAAHNVWRVYVLNDPNNTIYAATVYGLSIGTPSGNGNTISFANELTGFFIDNVYVLNNTIYAATYGQGLFIGNPQYPPINWTQIQSSIWWYNLANDFVLGVYAVSNDPNDTVYAATNYGLSVSSDGGNNWTTYRTPALGNNTITSVYVADNIIYAATQGGGLSISRDNGSNWITYAAGPGGLANNNVENVYALNNKIYASTDGGLSIGTDDGSGNITWANYTINQGLASNAVTEVAVLNDTNGTIYAATYGGGLSVTHQAPLPAKH